MTLIAHNELLTLAEIGVIKNVKPEQVNSTSIDITLGNKILIEKVRGMTGGKYPSINLGLKQPINVFEHNLDEQAYFLQPGEFILAQSEQEFNLPMNISAEYKLKSSMARIGLEHLNAGWCDAGWNGSVLTLELKNMTQYHTIILERGVGIGQVVFFKHESVPRDKSYTARGRYNNDKSASGAKQ